MTEFLFLFRSDSNRQPSPEEMQASVSLWQDWIGSIAAQGKFGGTNRLGSPGSKVIKAGGVVTDGPFVEVKELLGGYLIVKAETMDEAVALAQGCPIFDIGGSVEVRPVIAMN